MRGTANIRVRRLGRSALLLGAAAVAAGASLASAGEAQAVVGTDLGALALTPSSGATTVTPTYSTTEGCPAGYQGSAVVRAVANDGSNRTSDISPDASNISAPFSGTLLGSMGDIKRVFTPATPNGTYQEFAVYCFSGVSETGSQLPLMDTYVIWSADGSSYTETNTPPATTTALTASPSPASTGQTVTLTATVSDGGLTPTAPVGTVQFTVNGNPIGSPVTVNSNGVATTTKTFSDDGWKHLSAVFTPAQPNAFGSSTGTFTLQVKG
jgi:hypothetical protein